MATSTSIAIVLDYIRATFQPLATEKSLGFSVPSSRELPETLITDELRSLQALRNLLSNGIEFTESGALELFIHSVSVADMPPAARRLMKAVSGARDSDIGLVAFWDTDTGIGIEADKLGPIFDTFSQGAGSVSGKYAVRPRTVDQP